MKTEEFLSIKHFTVHKSQALIPATPETREWLELLKHNEPINFKVVEPRDIKFHRCYFALLSFVYDQLNPSFKTQVPKYNFYQFLKMLSKEYTVVFKFKDGREFIEYKSISFSRMHQSTFKEYVNNQLSVIYEELLIPMEQEYLMDSINSEFERFIDRLL